MYEISEFRFLYQVYHENKDKLHMTTSGKHPVNKEAVARWIERIGRLEAEDERNLYLFFAHAVAFALTTAYVTYEMFLRTVHAMADEILRKLESNSYERIVFVITGELNKSNTWVSLLLIDYFNTQPSFMRNSDKVRVVYMMGASNLAESLPPSPDERCLFLHVDDMAYSGGQSADAMNQIWTKSGLNRRANTEYYAAIPYLTTTAKRFIQANVPGVQFFESTILVPNILEQVQAYFDSLSATEQAANALYLPQVSKMCEKDRFFMSDSPTDDLQRSHQNGIPFAKGLWAFRCSTFKTILYFDHKLADDASTFQKVLYFGSYPINTRVSSKTRTVSPLCEQESLLTGCSIDPKVLSYMATGYTSSRSWETIPINACRNYIQYPGSKRWNIASDVVCPPTFYKTIDYTLGTISERYRNTNRKYHTRQIPYHLPMEEPLYNGLTNLIDRYIRNDLIVSLTKSGNPTNYNSMQEPLSLELEIRFSALQDRLRKLGIGSTAPAAPASNAVGAGAGSTAPAAPPGVLNRMREGIGSFLGYGYGYGYGYGGGGERNAGRKHKGKSKGNGITRKSKTIHRRYTRRRS